jgi:hypothetical protein
MRTTLMVHIAAGAVGIVSGFVSLYAAKGARLHRRAGVLFTGSMVIMGVLGAGMAAFRGELGNVIAGLLAAYMVVTGLNAVRPPTAGARRVDAGAMLAGLATGVAGVTLGVDSLAFGDGTRDGSPAAVFLVFGVIALLAGASDLRMMRSGPLRGARRLARHLWRMCFALFLAAGSFFLGQADVIPKPLRILPLLTAVSLLPLAAMLYWLWRVRRRPLHRDTATARAARALPPRAGSPVRAG